MLSRAVGSQERKQFLRSFPLGKIHFCQDIIRVIKKFNFFF